MASDAIGAFLTCVVIAGGVGPAFTLLFFWLHGMLRLGASGRDRFH